MINEKESDQPWLKGEESAECSSISPVSSPKSGFRKVYFAAFACLLFPLSMGTTGAYSATATEDMKRPSSRVIPTPDDVTWIGSLLALGALLGGAAAGYATDKLGRKGALMFYSIPFLAGWLFIIYASSVGYIFIGRFLYGISAGAICAIAPAYLVEISTPDIRGILGSFFQVCVCVGALSGTVFALYTNWQWQAVACSAFVVLAMATMSFTPESPRWLVAKGHHQAAVDSLTFLHGPRFDALNECASIHRDLSQQPAGNISFKEILSPGIKRPALLSIGIIIFQQLCGFNSILFYTVEVFKDLSTPISPYVSTMILYVTMGISTLGSGYLLDRLGRKLLLVISGAGMALSLFLLAGFDYAKSIHSPVIIQHTWLPLVAIMADAILFSVGFGPIPWLLIAEMSPNRARGLIAAVASAFCWGFVFFVTKSFDFLKLHIYGYGTYSLYGVFSALSCFFTVFCLPETKGKTCEEMNELFISKNIDKRKIKLKTVSGTE